MKKVNYFISIIMILTLFLITYNSSLQDNVSTELIQKTVSNKDSSVLLEPTSKIDICHYASSGRYVRISVSQQGLNGHRHHKRDVLNFDKDGDGYPVKNECNMNFRDDGKWDLDDNDPTITDGSGTSPR